MQDRFKFRVWHKKRKKMYEVLHLHVRTYDNGGDWATVKGFNIITQQDIHIQVQPKDCLLMQCTGLRDKNGKLIYEGDIVKDDHEALHQTVHCYNGFQLNPLFKNGYTIGIVDDEIEIIGNIYENPELLEDK